MRNQSLEDWIEGRLIDLNTPNPKPKPVAPQRGPLPWWLVPMGADDVLISKGVVEDQENHVKRNI